MRSGRGGAERLGWARVLVRLGQLLATIEPAVAGVVVHAHVHDAGEVPVVVGRVDQTVTVNVVADEVRHTVAVHVDVDVDAAVVAFVVHVPVPGPVAVDVDPGVVAGGPHRCRAERFGRLPGRRAHGLARGCRAHDLVVSVAR